jgi:MFS family permease
MPGTARCLPLALGAIYNRRLVQSLSTANATVTARESSDSHSAKSTLVVLSLAELFAMTLWFTGTTVLPQLAQAWHVNVADAGWVTIAVQFGFVAGALISAVFNLSDVIPASRLFAICAVGAAVVNALFAVVAIEHTAVALCLRFLTGLFLAGVYPPGMKIMASWFQQRRGVALGILVGALTVGKATPHALYGVQQFVGNVLPWRAVVFAGSALALIAAALVIVFVSEGPYLTVNPPFHLGQVGEMLRNRELRLANFGYFGHMWELYSMWGWLAVLLAAANVHATRSVLEAVSFLAISLGFLGCLWAGLAADRLPIVRSIDQPEEVKAFRVRARSRVTIIAMAVSGTCCLVAALVFHHFILLVGIVLVWGVAVIADSAQFSAIVSEVADQRYVGTALTFQTALGFLLTTLSLRTMALIGTNYGWRVATASLAIGPALGIIAMRRLQKSV